MKKTLLLFLLSISLITVTNAQCTISGTNFGNNTSTPSYNVSGDISVTLNANNTITLDLGTNFTTAAGPDVRAYLVNSEGKSTSELRNTQIANLKNIEFGLISCSGCNPVIPSNGAQSLTVAIPNDIDISNYDTIFFYCLRFNAFWDVGSFTPFSKANCGILSTENEEKVSFSVYPNPTKNKLYFDSLSNNFSELRVFNSLGKQVLYQKEIFNKEVDVSSLSKGIYMINMNVNDTFISKKLVIQ